MARELAPAGVRSAPKNGTATQSSGSKLPRHRGCRTLAITHNLSEPHISHSTEIPAAHADAVEQ
ncbi:hypothetical protein EAH78_30975 [Pseudomonas arsenicoxydans]|uniref:Uncharacterized protein n=1 Tax=Pseudomonas arsenicoxydans TaxID=702115 RepID=A0A502GW59_9PSED|nr:hypothetical protein EAH78_30975 [Pseudomonas arsenicoxydans]